MTKACWLLGLLLATGGLAACESRGSLARPAPGALDPSLGITSRDGLIVEGSSPIGAISSAGDGMVAWFTGEGVRARASSPDGTWGGTDEVVDTDVGDRPGALVATASGYTLTSGRLTKDGGAEALVQERDVTGKWAPPVVLGSGDPGWWQDPSPPRPALVQDRFGLSALWPSDPNKTPRTVMSALRVDGAWRPAVAAAAGDFVTSWPLDDASGGVLIAEQRVTLPSGDDNVTDAAFLHAASESWTFGASSPFDTSRTVWAEGPAASVAALKFGAVTPAAGVLRYVELSSAQPSPSTNVLLSELGSTMDGTALLLKTLPSGQIVIVYETFGRDSPGVVTTYFQVRDPNGTWSARWALPQWTLAAVVGPDGRGWTLSTTQVTNDQTSPWELRLRQFDASNLGSYGPDVFVTGGASGAPLDVRLSQQDGRVLVVGSFLAPMVADSSTLDSFVVARWFQATP